MLPALRALWRVCIKRPWPVFAVTLAITAISLPQFPQVRIDTDPENMLPADQPERVFHPVKRRYALHDAIGPRRASAAVHHHERGVLSFLRVSVSGLSLEGPIDCSTYTTSAAVYGSGRSANTTRLSSALHNGSRCSRSYRHASVTTTRRI